MSAQQEDRPDARELAEYARELAARRAEIRAERRTRPLPSDDPWTRDSAYRNA